MNNNKTVVSKFLVLDESGLPPESLKAFCEDCGLVAIKPQQGDADNVMAILRSNVDLGGILLHENYGGQAGQGVELAREIHASRPELPIFLRRDAVSSVAGLTEKDAAMFRCAYTLADLQQLRASLDASIFSRIYPNELVRGITEITRSALQPLFRDCEIDVETPYLVKDRIIYGEVFTMMAIDSYWCRGYMMLQAAEEAMMAVIRRTAVNDDETLTFRDLNNVLGEATNLAWGAFKSRYVADGMTTCQCQTQVPIIINHQRRYISFGSDDPQLCIKYTLRECNRPDAAPVALFQRFVFNLNWSPDEFRENPTVESLVESGELELF